MAEKKNTKEELMDSENIEISNVDEIDGDSAANVKNKNESKNKDNKSIRSNNKIKKYTKTKSNKKFNPIWGLIIVAIICIGIFTFFKNKKAPDMSLESQSETDVVTNKPIYQTSTATGTLYSGDARNVTTMLNEPSKIKNLYVEVGDYVNAGDILVEFSTDEINKNISEKQEDISLQKKQDAISAKDAERDYFRSYDEAATSLRDSADSVNQKLKDLYEACDAYGDAKEKYAEIEKERDEKLDEAHGEVERKSIEETYKTKLEIQQSNIDSAFMKKEAAEVAYSNAVKEQAKGVATQQDTLSKADSSYQKSNITSGKEVTNLQRQLEDLQDSLDKYVVKAPIDGLVTSVGVSEGNSFKEGTVATIQNNNVFTVTVKIDEYAINKVKSAYKEYCKNVEEGKTGYDIGTAKITTNGTDDLNITFSGHITDIAPTSVATTNYSSQSGDSNSENSSQSSSSSSTPSYEVKIVVDGLDETYISNNEIEDKLSEEEALELLMIGMTAKVRIVTDESEKDALTVPYNAVTKVKENDDSPYKYYVQVVTSEGNADASDINDNEIDVEIEGMSSDNSSNNNSGSPRAGRMDNKRGRNHMGKNKGFMGFLGGLFSKNENEETDTKRTFTKRVEVALEFENDYYCSVRPKIAGQLKVGDTVILTDEDSSSSEFFMDGPMGGF